MREVVELAAPQRRVVRWVAAPLPTPSGVWQLASLTDITAETDIAIEREELAFKDALTDMLNRRGAQDALSREEARARRHDTPLALAMVDIDAFKAINDAHGHAVGDRVIREVAAALKSTLRASDSAARWGGEEFLLILPDTTLEGAATLAERARAAAEALDREGDVRATISVGVARFDPYEPIDAAVARADEALYRAKSAGRNRVSD